jgi:hypothetical protein
MAGTSQWPLKEKRAQSEHIFDSYSNSEILNKNGLLQKRPFSMGGERHVHAAVSPFSQIGAYLIAGIRAVRLPDYY